MLTLVYLFPSTYCIFLLTNLSSFTVLLHLSFMSFPPSFLSSTYLFIFSSSLFPRLFSLLCLFLLLFFCFSFPSSCWLFLSDFLFLYLLECLGPVISGGLFKECVLVCIPVVAHLVFLFRSCVYTLPNQPFSSFFPS